MAVLPTLDIERFKSLENGIEKKEILETVRYAFSILGGIQIQNHGISSSVRERAKSAAKKFFNLNQETKNKYFNPEAKGLTGYMEFKPNQQYFAAQKIELFHSGLGSQPEGTKGYLYPNNIWPTEVNDFENASSEFYQQFLKCTNDLLEIMSLAVGLDKNYFSNLCKNGWSTLRYNRMGKNHKKFSGDLVVGIPHFDFTLLTFLSEGTKGGLSYRNEKNEWISVVTNSDDTFVIGAGTILESITNGYFKGLFHRVCAESSEGADRVGTPFFVCPPPFLSMRPLPEFIELTGGIKKYEDTTVAEHVGKMTGTGTNLIFELVETPKPVDQYRDAVAP